MYLLSLFFLLFSFTKSSHPDNLKEQLKDGKIDNIVYLRKLRGYQDNMEE